MLTSTSLPHLGVFRFDDLNTPLVMNEELYAENMYSQSYNPEEPLWQNKHPPQLPPHLRNIILNPSAESQHQTQTQSQAQARANGSSTTVGSSSRQMNSHNATHSHQGSQPSSSLMSQTLPGTPTSNANTAGTLNSVSSLASIVSTSSSMPAMNGEAVKRRDRPTQLTEPIAVTLNHLYCSAIKDNLMVLGTTDRYREKFVTTVLYSPLTD